VNWELDYYDGDNGFWRGLLNGWSIALVFEREDMAGRETFAGRGHAHAIQMRQVLLLLSTVADSLHRTAEIGVTSRAGSRGNLRCRDSVALHCPS
jgi:hypothetical protein